MSSQRMLTGSALVNVMVAAAQKAGRALVRDFGEIEQLQVSRKSLGEFVSTADLRSEKIIIQELQKARPPYGFLIEESGQIQGTDSENTWVIDPLDGTSNFLHGIPQFAISIALKRKHEIVAGVVYNPVIDELYWAEKGSGAFLNQRRLRVSGRQHIDEALIACGTPYSRRGNSEKFINSFRKLVNLVSGVRRFGCAALDLCYVASGRLDGCFEMNLKSWDIAAGALLVKEAGGYVCDFDGEQSFLDKGSVIAGNEAIFSELKKAVTG
jgi:myo-inositol-1(or 4)-monophosphatase